MSNALTSARRIEPSPPCIEADPATAYLHATAAQLAAALREVAPRLVAPRTVNLDRARRVLGHFVETMTGFALGTVAHHLMTGLRRWLGEDASSVWRPALHGWPHHARIETEGPAAEQLHVRFSLANAQVRALVEALPNGPRIGPMLSALAQDDAIRDRVAHELSLGWRVYTAAVTTKRYPPLDRLWQAWVWQLDGRPVLTRDETEQAGYITRVR